MPAPITGESWQRLGVGKHFGLAYCRGLALKTDDPNTVFVATGDTAVGSDRRDRALEGCRQELGTAAFAGRAELADLGVCDPSRPIPGLIFACSHYGELFASEDAGDSWRKLPRELTEIRALVWTPN